MNTSASSVQTVVAVSAFAAAVGVLVFVPGEPGVALALALTNVAAACLPRAAEWAPAIANVLRGVLRRRGAPQAVPPDEVDTKPIDVRRDVP